MGNQNGILQEGQIGVRLRNVAGLVVAEIVAKTKTSLVIEGEVLHSFEDEDVLDFEPLGVDFGFGLIPFPVHKEQEKAVPVS